MLLSLGQPSVEYNKKHILEKKWQENQNGTLENTYVIQNIKNRGNKKQKIYNIYARKQVARWHELILRYQNCITWKWIKLFH